MPGVSIEERGRDVNSLQAAVDVEDQRRRGGRWRDVDARELGQRRYRDRGLPFRAWLLRIARTLSVDEYRQQRAGFAWDGADTAQLASSEPRPEMAVLQREAMRRPRTLIDGLDPDKRELTSARTLPLVTVGD